MAAPSPSEGTWSLTDQMSAQGLAASDWWFCGADKSGGSRPPPQVKPQFPRRGCISIPSLLLLSHARETPTPVQSLIVDPRSLEVPARRSPGGKAAVAAFGLARHPGGGREGVAILCQPRSSPARPGECRFLSSGLRVPRSESFGRAVSDGRPSTIHEVFKPVICDTSKRHPRVVLNFAGRFTRNMHPSLSSFSLPLYLSPALLSSTSHPILQAPARPPPAQSTLTNHTAATHTRPPE